MKCRICGVEYSDKVLRIHEPLCQKPIKVATIVADELTEEQLRALAKDKGVRSWHNKAIDKIKTELAEMSVI